MRILLAANWQFWVYYRKDSNEKWLCSGIQERFDKWRKLLGMQGINANDYIGIEFNLNMPIDTKEKFENLQIMRNMGAISVQTIMEQSEMIKDTSIEMTRIKSEGNVLNNKENKDMGKDKEDSVK